MDPPASGTRPQATRFSPQRAGASRCSTARPRSPTAAPTTNSSTLISSPGARAEMAVTAAQARKLALSFEGTEERPHFDRFAFRTPRKTFATLAGDGSDINLMFDAALQELYCEQAAESFAPVPGGWG